MARGFLGGFVVGAVLSVCAAAIISVVAGPPVPPEIVSSAPVAGDTPSEGADAAPAPRVIEGDLRQPATSDLGEPDPADGPAVGDDATRPASRPQTASATPGVSGPAPMAATGGVTVERAAPVPPGTRVPHPGAVKPDDPAAIATEPPRPGGMSLSMPEGLGGGDAALPAPSDDGAEGPVAPAADSSLADMIGGPAPRAPGQPDQPAVSAETAPRPDTAPPRLSLGPASRAAPDSPMAEPGRDAATESPPDVETDAPGLKSPEDDRDLRVDLTSDGGGGRSEAAVPDGTNLPSDDAAKRGGPMIGTPATSLLDRERAAPPSEAEGAATAPGSLVDADAPAILHNGQEFENTDDLPLVSIVLMDTGQALEDGPVGLAALDSFPYPLSIAVDTSLPDAADRAARHRAEGFEVMALVDLPQNLTPPDIEVALPRLLDRVPGAVAVLEGPGSGLQGSPEMSAQVGAVLQETGHGIVWQPSGLGTAQRSVARDGVASQTLFRDIDGEGQTPLVIRRALDQAAFRASREGPVIMVGRLRPETITALVIWGLQDPVRGVAVAPVSAALLEGREGG